MTTRQAPATAPVLSANAAGLRYVTDRIPGIRRIPARKGFRYLGPNGQAVRDQEALRRIAALVIPPAWTSVWISPIAESHLQAVGRDARNRKQYRYHPRWREVRDETKYHRMISFGKLLPKIRAQVNRDLQLPGLSRRKVLATIVRLIETTLIRVGNEEYARQNSSFGLTTLRDHHVHVSGKKLSFYFRGKSRVKHSISIEDSHLAKIVKRLRDLPGYEIFQYVDDEGVRYSIGSGDVNDYLREVSGEDITSKEFRTWNGTVLAAIVLSQNAVFKSESGARKKIVKAIELVAQRLGNTVAVCRKCYIHPAVIEAYMDRSLGGINNARTRTGGLRHEEAIVLSFLERRLKQQAKRSGESLEQKLERSIRNVTGKKHGPVL